MQSIVLVGLTLGNSAAGFLLQVLIAKIFGVGATTDAYFRAAAAPLFCVGLFSAQSTFRAVPALMLRAEEGEREWRASARSYLLTSVVLGLSVAVVGSVAWPNGELLRAGGSSRTPSGLGVLCWAFGATQFPLLATGALLQSRHRYSTALIAMGLPQIASCLALLALPWASILAVPACQALAGAACSLAAVAILGWRRETGAAGEGAGFGRRAVLESPFTAATLACFSVYAVIDSALLPLFGEGFLTTASFCQRLVIGVGQIAIAAPMTLVTRELVQHVHARDPAGFRRTLLAALARVAAASLLLVVVLFLTADPLMHLLLTKRGGNAFDTAVASRTLRQMLPGMLFMLSSNILVRSALTVPGLVRRTWWLGAVWGVLYAVALASFSTPGFNGSGYAYSISWAVASVSFGYFVWRSAPELITDGQPCSTRAA